MGKKSFTSIPTLLVIYNRPQIVKKLLKSLATIQPKKLYVFCDGPKDEKDNKLVLETRQLFATIPWECQLQTKFLKRNVGCRRGVSSAIDWLFTNEEAGIILEDDCIPNASFFAFVELMLQQYKADLRISQICGYNSGFRYRGKESYFFSTYSSSWGWATWKDRWSSFAWFSNNGAALLGDANVSAYLTTKSIPAAYVSNVKKTLSGSLDSWDYLWSISNILNNRLSIVPSKNLISNIGFGKDSTNTQFSTHLANLPLEKISKKFTHPQVILPNYEYDMLKRRRHIKMLLLLDIIKGYVQNFAKSFV